MILALGASGRGFDSHSSGFFLKSCLVARAVNGTDLKSVGLRPREFKSALDESFFGIKSF